MVFLLYFQKVIFFGGDNFFTKKFFLKKSNTPEYTQVLVVTWAKLNSVTTLLSPRPNISRKLMIVSCVFVWFWKIYHFPHVLVKDLHQDQLCTQLFMGLADYADMTEVTWYKEPGHLSHLTLEPCPM